MPNYCPNCGGELTGDKYCPECGEEITKETRDSEASDEGSQENHVESSGGGLKKLFYIFALIGVVAVFLYGPQIFFFVAATADEGYVEQLEIEQVQINDISLGSNGLTAELGLTVNNPNPVPAEAGKMTYDVLMNGEKVAEGETSENYRIGANSNGTVNTDLDVDEIGSVSSALGMAWNSLTGADSTVAVQGEIEADLWIHSISIPFEKSETV